MLSLTRRRGRPAAASDGQLRRPKPSINTYAIDAEHQQGDRDAERPVLVVEVGLACRRGRG